MKHSTRHHVTPLAKQRLRGLLAITLLSGVFATAQAQQLCPADAKPTWQSGRLVCSSCLNPPYTVRRHALIGNPAELPEGRIVFTYGNDTWPPTQEGVFISSVRSWNPVSVPNTAVTSGKGASFVQWSDDGKWILYTLSGNDDGENHSLWLIKPDGSGKTQVPTNGGYRNCGFMRNSILGHEIWWQEQRGANITAVTVNLSGNTPVFGSPRSLGPVGYKGGNGKEMGFGFSERQRAFGARGRMYGGMAGGQVCVTLPDTGKQAFDTIEQCMAATFGGYAGRGCGYAMSWDGEIIIDNSQGPKTWESGAKMHLGPRIYRWTNPGEPTADGAADRQRKYGLGVNWAPRDFYADDTNDLHLPQFANHREFISWRRINYGGPNQGFYILHWPSNTWFPLGLQNKNVIHSNVFFDNPPGEWIQPKDHTPATANVFHFAPRK